MVVTWNVAPSSQLMHWLACTSSRLPAPHVASVVVVVVVIVVVVVTVVTVVDVVVAGGAGVFEPYILLRATHALGSSTTT